MKIVVKDGNIASKVCIVHWWPDREYFDWTHTSPIPIFMRHRAEKKKSKYMTMVYVNLPVGHLSTLATCCQKDHPTRAKGRFIALLRMGRLLKAMGLKMERTQ